MNPRREQEAREDRARLFKEGKITAHDMPPEELVAMGITPPPPQRGGPGGAPGGGGGGPGGGGPGVGAFAGSLDEGDPYTTNLYVGNLAPDVDEQVLIREFGRWVAARGLVGGAAALKERHRQRLVRTKMGRLWNFREPCP